MAISSECNKIGETLNEVLVNIGAAYDRELTGDRARAKFWLNNAKRRLDALQKIAPEYGDTVRQAKEVIDKLAESKPEDYYFTHDMVTFKITDDMLQKLVACELK